MVSPDHLAKGVALPSPVGLGPGQSPARRYNRFALTDGTHGASKAGNLRGTNILFKRP